MEIYIAILRGINVSGHKVIKMADLKTLFEDMKFKDVITYIQSGNVIFKTDKKESDLELSKKIGGKILTKYKFEVPIIIRNVKEIESILKGNPFLKETDVDMEKLHVTFLAEKPAKAELDTVNKINHIPDRFIISGKEVFLYCHNGYGNTKLSNTFFENKLKVLATTRNWKTVNKLAELAK